MGQGRVHWQRPAKCPCQPLYQAHFCIEKCFCMDNYKIFMMTEVTIATICKKRRWENARLGFGCDRLNRSVVVPRVRIAKCRCPKRHKSCFQMIPTSWTLLDKFGRFSMAEHFHGARMRDKEIRKERVSLWEVKFIKDSYVERLNGFHSKGIYDTSLPKFPPTCET